MATPHANPMALNTLARLELTDGRPAAAVALAARLGQADHPFLTARDRYGYQISAHFLAGMAAARQGDDAAALRAFAAIRAPLAAGDVPLGVDALAYFLAYGDGALRQGQRELAAACYTAALRLAPGHEGAARGLAAAQAAAP